MYEIVSNATPLIYLAPAQRLSIYRSKVVVPVEVYVEVVKTAREITHSSKRKENGR